MLQSRLAPLNGSCRLDVEYRAILAVLLVMLGGLYAYLFVARDPAHQKAVAEQRLHESEQALKAVDRDLQRALTEGGSVERIQELEKEIQRLNVEALACSLELEAQHVRGALNLARPTDYRRAGSLSIGFLLAALGALALPAFRTRAGRS